jgi:chromosome partitioning protein
MAKIIAIMNEKGGVGKTATATALAYLLAKSGKKTALIDFDGQGHASIICGVKNPNKLEVTISTLLNKVIMDEPLPPVDSYLFRGQNGIDLIPANSQLFVLERNLCNVDFREYKLSEYVGTIKDLYEYIIIDCMPQIGTPMVNVMMCADSIVIPTQAEILSAQGLSELLRHYHTIQKNSNHNLRIEGILITMDTDRTIVSSQVRSMIDNSFEGKIPIFKTHIPRSIKVAEACLYQQTICEYIPDNPAAVAYEKFVKELMENGHKSA